MFGKFLPNSGKCHSQTIEERRFVISSLVFVKVVIARTITIARISSDERVRRVFNHLQPRHAWFRRKAVGALLRAGSGGTSNGTPVERDSRIREFPGSSKCSLTLEFR